MANTARNELGGKKPCQVFPCGYASISSSGRLQKGNKGASSLAVSDVRHLHTRKSRGHVVSMFVDIFPFLLHLFGTLSVPCLLFCMWKRRCSSVPSF